MKQIPSTELHHFKKYFADLFHEFLREDLNKYFAPYYDDKYCIDSGKISFHLWGQYKSFIHLIEDPIEIFTDSIFNQYTDDDRFIDFLYAYKIYSTAMWKLNTMDFAGAMEFHHEKTMAIYHQSNFRFNTEERIKEFCKLLQKEKKWDQLYRDGKTDKQKEICRLFADHFINRLPISGLPKTNSWNSWQQSIMGWFSS